MVKLLVQMFLGENVSGENVSGENVSGENVSLYPSMLFLDNFFSFIDPDIRQGGNQDMTTLTIIQQ